MIYRIRRRLALEAAPEAVWDALSDFAAYAAWMPGVSASEVLSREAGIAIVELRPTKSGHPPAVFEVVETEPRRSLTFTQVGLLERRGVTGRVEIGRKGDRVDLEVEVTIRCPFYRPVSRRAWRQAIAERTSALQARAWRLETGEVSTRRSSAEKVLELRRRDGGLELWVRGESYRLESS